MLKLATFVIAVMSLVVFARPASAQLIPHGNVYAGVSYSDSDIVIANRQGLKGWNGSGEVIFFRHIGVVFDASGYYRSDVTQYNYLAGPRLSMSFGKWRPFVHLMGGIQRVKLDGTTYSPVALDFGGGIDYKFLRVLAWRVQADYVRTHYLSADQNDGRASTGIVYRF